MGMTRRQIRENIFRILFELDFYTDEDVEEQLALYFEPISEETLLSVPVNARQDEEDGRWYTLRFTDEEDVLPVYASERDRREMTQKVRAVRDLIPQIDAALDETSRNWSTGRMPRTDLAVLRLAVYEIRHDEKVPGKVAINEAVELAKQYGSGASASFVNGILAKFI